MPILKNAKHERFAQELAQGKSQADAYKLSGYKSDSGAASRLSGNVSISKRVAELLGRVADGVVLSKQWVLERLVENVDRAMQAEEIRDNKGVGTGEYRYEGSVANRALELAGQRARYVRWTAKRLASPASLRA